MVLTQSRTRRWEMLNKDSIELNKLAKQFELYNRTEGKSQATIDWYNLVLRLFHCFLETQGKPTELGELGETEAREFILDLQQRDKSRNYTSFSTRQGKLQAITVQTYVRGLRAFFNWLFEEGYTTENRLRRLRPPRAPTKLVEILTPEEIDKVIASFDRDSPPGARDSAMLILFLDTGLRCSELRNAQLDETNIESGYLKVMGKGRKERIVPFGITAQRVLSRYVLHFRPDPFSPSIQAVFLTLDGKPLTKNSVNMIFRRLAEKCGVKRLHPHLCRHTFATNYLINGGDVFSLQQILGHTSLEMVRRYVALASAHVAVQHRKFSPMDMLNISKPNASRRGRGNQGPKWRDSYHRRPRR